MVKPGKSFVKIGSPLQISLFLFILSKLPTPPLFVYLILPNFPPLPHHPPAYYDPPFIRDPRVGYKQPL